MNCWSCCICTWFASTSFFAGLSCEKIWLLCCGQGQGHSEGWYDQNMTLSTIFWTIDSLATKLGLMIYHHKPECPVKEVGLLHSGSGSQWRVKMLLFVQMIFYKPPSILFPRLILWCIIMQELIWSKYDNFYCIFWTAKPFATKLGLIVQCHNQSVLWRK